MSNRPTFALWMVLSAVLLYPHFGRLFAQATDGKAKEDFLPASPDAAALGRFGEVPVNLSTGVPNISVPIFEIKEGNITLPISLNYNASGIKVQQEATTVGLGWSLNAGGAITRITRGLADESPYGFFKNRQTIKKLLHSEFTFLETQVKNGDIVQGRLDSEPDLFICNIGGLNFKFSMNLEGEFVTFPFSNYKIAYGQTNQNDPKTGTWSITDDQGNGYLFGGFVQAPIPFYLVETLRPNQGEDKIDPTAWFINYIKPSAFAQFNTDRIRFEYTPSLQFGAMFFQETVYRLASACYLQFAPPPPSNTYHQSHTQTVVLKKITYAQGEVRFHTVKDRLDNGSMYRLASISQYGQNNVLINTCTLKHDYFNAPFPNKRLKLKGCVLGLENITHDITGELIHPKEYHFEYFENLPLPDINALSQDHWGYYNGKNNTTLIPTVKIAAQPAPNPIVTFTSTGDRAVNPTTVHLGTLKKITYPTGGISEFEFEPNTQHNVDMEEKLVQQTKDANGNFYFGGLRVKRITTIDPYHPADPMIKRFHYDDSNGASFGRIMEMPIYAFYQSRMVEERFSCGIGECVVYHDSCDYVVIKQNSQFNLVGNSGEILYEKVTVFNGENGEGGKEVKDYDYMPIPLTYLHKELPFAAVWQPTWRFNPNTETSYKNDAGVFKPVSKAEHLYSSIYLGHDVWGYKVGIQKMWQVYTTDTPTPLFSMDDYNAATYVVAHESFYNDFTHPSKKTESVFSTHDNTVLVTTTETTIDPASLKPASVKTTNSAGQTEEIRTKYAANYTLSNVNASSPYPIRGIYNLQQRNIPGAPVEVTKIVNDHVVHSSGTVYHHNFPLPIQEYSVKSEQPIHVHNFTFSEVQGNTLVYDPRYEADLEYVQYDLKSNPLLKKMKDGMASAYLWDYNNTLPVASITLGNPDTDLDYIFSPNKELTSYKQNFAFTSFEGENYGNWQDVNPNSIVSTMAPTGSKAYDVSSGKLSFDYYTGKGGLFDYYAYYWMAPGAQITVEANGAAITGDSLFVNANGWLLMRHTLKNCNSVQVSGSGLLDELRLFTTNSRMTTYTHIPGIGTQSITDENCRTQYFFYDDFARLQHVRDMEGNILKTIDYQFQK